MRVFIIGADKMNWSIDKDRQHTENFIKGLEGYKITRNPLAADIFYFVWYSQAVRYLFLLSVIRFFKRKVVVVITNKITDHLDKLEKLRPVVDVWVSPNSFTSDFLTEKGVHFVQMPFYVSPQTFFPLKSEREKIASEFKIDADKLKDKIVIGSFQRDSAGRDLQQQKWHKNPKLLIEITKELTKTTDKEVVLLLAGPRRHYIVNQCKSHSIPYIFVGDITPINNGEDDVSLNNLDEKTINKLYGLIDLYLVTSVSEGGPKALFEAPLTKTLVFSTNVGMATDVLPAKLILDLDKPAVEFAAQINVILKDAETSEQLVSDLYEKVSADLAFDQFKKNFLKVLSS